MIQLITPTPNIPCQPGWCLQYVRQAFGLPARYPTATAAWQASSTQHPDRDYPPGVAVPVWYGLDREPAGHVVILMPDGTVYSTSDNSTTPHHHPSLTDLEDYYSGWGWPLTYRGWTEDVAGFPVIAADPASITAMGDTITPLPLEDDMPTPKDLWDYPITLDGKDYAASDVLRYARLNAAQANEKADAALKAITGLLGTRLPAPDGSGHSYTLAEYITYGWAYSMNAGPRTLGQEIRLADGTVTSLASLLAAIYQKPAAAGSVDVEALVARLKAELPAATVTALATQLAK